MFVDIRNCTPGAHCIKFLSGEITPVKYENSGKHDFTIDFTIGKKNLWLK